MENEWYLNFHTSSGYRLSHKHKNGYSYLVWTSPAYRLVGFPDLVKYHCMECNKKAPDHLILQWKLLNGK